MKVNLFKKENTFEQEIREAFANIISSNNFELNKVHELFELVNDKIVIEIWFSMGELGCSFHQTGQKLNIYGLAESSYSVIALYNYFKSVHVDKFAIREIPLGNSRLEQLKSCAEILNDELNFILKGDFSWETEYLEHKRKEEKKMGLLWELDMDHPIKQKFHNNDSSWYNDLDQYIKANGIVL